MNLQKIKEKYPELKEYHIKDLPLYAIIWTTVGVYGDQTIYEILDEKMSDIRALDQKYKDGGYCLWALNKFSPSRAICFCYRRTLKNEPIYVIMKLTKSNNAVTDESEMKSSDKILTVNFNTIKCEHVNSIELNEDYENDLSNLHLILTSRNFTTQKSFAGVHICV